MLRCLGIKPGQESAYKVAVSMHGNDTLLSAVIPLLDKGTCIDYRVKPDNDSKI